MNKNSPYLKLNWAAVSLVQNHIMCFRRFKTTWQVFPEQVANTYLLDLYFYATKLVENDLKIGGDDKNKICCACIHTHTQTHAGL